MIGSKRWKDVVEKGEVGRVVRMSLERYFWGF